MVDNDRIVVIGNGPSLKKEYFVFFNKCSTLGMNAAYRYWERINWYPDVYCCLDDQVVLSHADAIQHMIEQKLCSFFFLHPNLLQLFPASANAQGVYFLPQLREGQNNKDICDKYKLDFIPQAVFKSKKPGKLTTGSYAVRFASFLGFRKIGLIGIDCRYTEIIKEATLRDGIVLEIERTPQKNPNYFFDDYQIKGDLYNIPNPDIHQGNLHLQAFEALRDDIQSYRFDLDVQICSPESEIYDQNVFPYVALSDYIVDKRLSAVFVPFVRAELHRLMKRLRLWGCQEFAPFMAAPTITTVELHFAYNGAHDAQLENAISRVYFESGLSRYFAGLHFHYSNLDGLRDLYTRNFVGPVGPEGYMAGPNNQFFDIIQQFSAGMSHIAVIEADVIPIRSNWLAVIEDIVSGSDPFWICGSQYRGVAQIQAFSHINGNAIYNVGSREFQEFFNNTFLPFFYERVKEVPSICYDILLHDMFHQIYSGKSDEGLFKKWSNVAHRFRFSEYIVDVSHASDHQPEALLTLEEARVMFPDAYLFHGAIEKIEIATPTSYRQSSHMVLPDFLNPVSRVVMLDPDALGHFGHYLAYDEQLEKTLKPYAVSFQVLANRQLPESISASRPYFTPCLSDHSWTIGIPNSKTHSVDPTIIQRFEDEVETFVRLKLDISKEPNICVYMYCAGIPHAQAIARLVERLPQISATLNLFYLPFQQIRSREFQEYWVPILKQLVLEERLVLTVPTDLMAHDLLTITGIDLPVTPHPSPTISDRVFSLIQRGEFPMRSRRDSRLTVLFPGTGTQGKAHSASLAAANWMASSKLDGRDLRIILRDARKTDTPKEQSAIYESLHPLVEMFKGQFSNEEFLSLFLMADIVVLPYMPDMFKYRNSGLLVDAIYCGKPVVAVKDTWLGNVIQKSGAGVVVSSISPEAIFMAVSTIARNLKVFSKNAYTAAKDFFVSNSWDRLGCFVANIKISERVPATQQVEHSAPLLSEATSQKEPITLLGSNTAIAVQSSRGSMAKTVKSKTAGALWICPGSSFAKVAEGIWRYTHSDVMEQKLWVAVFDPSFTTVSRTFLAGIQIASNKNIQLLVSLGRHGKTDYEGTQQKITLLPGVAQKLQLNKLFLKEHFALKVQIQVLELPEGLTADLTIDSIYITESLPSARQRTATNELKLSVANRLFRDNDYSKAMCIYLHLYELCQLKMYADNALMCAIKSGIKEVQSVEQLVKLIEPNHSNSS